MSPPRTEVFLYERSDRERVMQIGSDTAFFGAPIEAYLEDRRIFEDFFYSYYLSFEPAHCWVASEDGLVVGFLAGCTNTKTYNSVMLRHYFPSVIRKYFNGKYTIGPKTKQYAWKLALSWLHGEYYTASKKRFPAHLHINVLKEWRGLGLGQRLMQAYLSQLRGLGIRGVHLHTTNLNFAACTLYEHTGFRLLKTKKSGLWRGIIDQPVENRCYGLELHAEQKA